ncbi:hypothetical protein [Nonomuraea sp. NPDC049709]
MRWRIFGRWSERRHTGAGPMCPACAMDLHTLCPCLIVPWQVTR